MKYIALCGNPNCGKSTLFNLLTGSNQKVGNWAGVTVEYKYGLLKGRRDVTVVDTPGIYSLTPFSPDEQVTLNYLTDSKPDLIINVADATNLQRSLYLTMQLARQGIPMVVALNLQDEAEKLGIRADADALEREIGCKFFGISAAKAIGTDKLTAYCLTLLTRSHCARALPNSTPRSPAQSHDSANGQPAERQAQDMYAQIDRIIARCVTQRAPTADSRSRTDKIDAVLLNKWLAFPIFAAVMTAVFYISVGGPGRYLSNLLEEYVLPLLRKGISALLRSSPAWLRSLALDGLTDGVMSVLGFTPQVMLLFGCIALLEASGYMARIALLTDRLLRQIGLGGRSFVSLVLGCGCSVPAINATRGIKSQSERIATATLTPMMPCSAKLAVIAYFTAQVFDGNALIAMSFYLLSIVTVIAGGAVLKAANRRKRNEGDIFVLELPPYRAPTPANVLKQMWLRGKAFVAKAGTVILAASGVMWFLKTFGADLQMTDVDNSLLALLGKALSPIFVPLGFDDGGCGWQFSVAALSGIAAKETVVTTLNILLPQGAANCISALGAYSFVAYNLLTVPCVAATAASFAEQGRKNGLKAMLFQSVTAYIVCLTLYQGTLLLRAHTAAVGALIAIAAVIALSCAVAHKTTAKRCCDGCTGCHTPKSK